MIKKITFLFSSILLLTFMAPSFSGTNKLPEIVFILDASGSMHGSAGDKTKIVAAKQVLHQMVPSLAKEINLGLVAYGHNRKGDCNDISILVPAGSNDRQAILAHVDAINPKGMTPIAQAIILTAESLKDRENETTIVLVSDGKETCHPNPCAVVETLKKTGIKFVLHVVGFDVSTQEKQQLTCLAKAGGGDYFAANDMASLKLALQKVQKEVEVKVEQAKTSTKRKSTGLGKLQVTMPQAALKSLDSIKVTRKKDNKVIKQAKMNKANSMHPMMSGDYQLVLAFANANYAKPTEVIIDDFSIEKGKVTHQDFGAIIFNVAPGLKHGSVDGITLVDAKTGKPWLTTMGASNNYYVFKAKPAKAGDYLVQLHYFRFKQPTTVAKVKVEKGKQSVVTLDSGIQLEKPADTAGDVKSWWLVSNETQKKTLFVKRGWDNQAPLWSTFAATPGHYQLYI